MPSTEQLPSGKHRGIYRDGAGKRAYVPGTFPTQQEAYRKAIAAEEKAKTEGPRRESEYAKAVKWGDIRDDWRKARRVSAGTARRDDSRISNHLEPRWNEENVRKISTPDIQRWVDDDLIIKAGLSASSVAKCVHNLSSSMAYCVEKGIRDDNPCKGVILPDIHPLLPKFIEDDAHHAVRRTLPQEYQDVVDVLDDTGMRPGEAAALHAEDIDRKNRIVYINWSYDPSTQTIQELKDDECRAVPYGNRAAAVFDRRLSENGYGEPPTMVTYIQRSRRVETGLILRQPNGRPYSDSELRKSLRASARIAYVGKGRERRNVGRMTPYMWRHRYAKRMLLGGLSIDELSKLMGHSSIDTTKKWYGHLAEKSWSLVRAILNDRQDTTGHCPSCTCAERSAAA
ncbi:Tyr recombinase domain-containing protein [Nocardia ninae]|uniref:Tyr recombinase domain-containing protein n=1 Tax=Nocardia ninae NBRC 108245 TaxID=1210091 RepID=A0A511MP63_9NOCA|nr:tyrosine-type recombinase/integrase [Nocardia ninae]GEM41927.1 hypothetical protein NN4_64460 [Nocardia ninae NBRC 108245]